MSNPNSADWTVERNIRERQSAGSGINGQNVRIVFSIGREHQGYDLRFIAEPLRKQRADGPVNLAAGENFAFAGTAFTLDEASGYASAGVRVFTVVDGQGE